MRSRVERHSPSFRFKDAELERLIDLVTDCSASPHFEGKTATAEQLANELVRAQDEEREQMKRLSEQFTRSFASITKLSRAFQPQIASWATGQQRAMAALSKIFAAPRLGAVSLPTVHEQMSALGLTASVRKEMFPTLQTMSAIQLAATPSGGLLAQRIRLPNTIAGELSKSLSGSFGIYSTQTMPPALRALAQRRTATISDVLRVAEEAADVVEAQGEHEEARELRAVSAEVVAIAESPSVENVEQVVANLSEHVNERFDELTNQIETNEQRRQADRRDDLTLTVFFFFLEVYLALFLFMLEQLPRN